MEQIVENCIEKLAINEKAKNRLKKYFSLEEKVINESATRATTREFEKITTAQDTLTKYATVEPEVGIILSSISTTYVERQNILKLYKKTKNFEVAVKSYIFDRQRIEELKEMIKRNNSFYTNWSIRQDRLY